MRKLKRSVGSAMLALYLGALVGLLLGAGLPAAWARTPEEITQIVQDKLGERHPSDTAAWWLGLGPEAPSVIISLYEKEESVPRKTRLLGGLAWFKDDARALDFVKAETEHTDQDVIRQTGVRALARSAGVRELDTVSKYLKHPDPSTRLAAAQAIKGMNDAKANQVLNEALKTEKATWIADRVNRKTPDARVLSPLTPSGSSEDRALESYVGNWRGWLLIPDKSQPQRFRSIEASLRFSQPEGDHLSAELSFQEKGKKVTARPFLVRFKAERLEASIPVAGLSAALKVDLPQASELAAQGEVSGKESDAPIIRLFLPRVPGQLVLTRD